MSTSVRRRLAVASMVLLVPVLGACGFGEQTDQVYQPAVGVNDRTRSIDVLGAVVVDTGSGQGLFIASLVNPSQGRADKLTGLSGDGIQASLQGPIEVPSGELVNLARQGGVQVSGSSVKAGNFVRLTLQFAGGQQTDLDVPVVAQTGPYASISPSASPSSSPSASPSGKKSGKPPATSPGAKPSGTRSPSASPSP